MSENRNIDKTAVQSYKNLRNSFSLVTKVRAGIWVTTAVIVFVGGFILGIIYVANGDTFRGI